VGPCSVEPVAEGVEGFAEVRGATVKFILEFLEGDDRLETAEPQDQDLLPREQVPRRGAEPRGDDEEVEQEEEVRVEEPKEVPSTIGRVVHDAATGKERVRSPVDFHRVAGDVLRGAVYVQGADGLHVHRVVALRLVDLAGSLQRRARGDALDEFVHAIEGGRVSHLNLLQHRRVTHVARHGNTVACLDGGVPVLLADVTKKPAGPRQRAVPVGRDGDGRGVEAGEHGELEEYV